MSATRTNPYHLVIEIAGLPSMNSSGFRNHWARRGEKHRWYEEVRIAVRGRCPARPLTLAQVEITRHSGSRRPDYDNLVQGGKFLLDGLVRSGVLSGDNPGVIGVPIYLWAPAKPRCGHVKIKVLAATGECP